ncbi:MAG TPA: hypothetical protein VMV18_01865 [bacterium]|nr:hypothetical protein [bacterium]
MAKRAKEPALPRGLSEEQQEEILERRRQVAAELAAREAERKAAWEEHERERKDAEARRKATEPPKEFVEAARAARERLEKEHTATWRKAFEAECRRRNPDEKLEERFRDEHADAWERHLVAFAHFQESMGGSDENEKREAVQRMAAAWKEKEDLLLALAASRRKKNVPDPLEARTETLKGKLETMEKIRKSATPKPKKAPAAKKKPEPKAKAKAKSPKK